MRVPPDIRQFRLPRLVRELATDTTTLGATFAWVITVLVISARHTPLWMLCFTSPTAPVLAALWFWLQPINPYRLSPIPASAGEDDIRRLFTARLRSGAAKYYSLRVGWRIAPCTTVLSIVLAYAWRNSSWWRPAEPKWILANEFLLAIACYGLIAQLLLRWGVREVLKSQGESAQEETRRGLQRG